MMIYHWDFFYEKVQKKIHTIYEQNNATIYHAELFIFAICLSWYDDINTIIHIAPRVA